MAYFKARFFDGQKIQPLSVNVEVGADKLTLFYLESDQEKIIHWPITELQVIEPAFQGRPGVIGCKSVTGARLIIDESNHYVTILRLISKKQIVRSIVPHSWKKLIGLAVLITLIFIFLLGGVHFFAPFLAKHVPAKWEDRLGVMTIEQIAKDRQECISPAGRKALQKMVRRLSSSLTDQPPFDVKVLKWQGVNAFAAPGHHLIILSGLLQWVDTPEEVAGILAHEMGHAIEHHQTRSIFRDTGFRILIAAAFGSSFNFVSDLLRLKYSRQDEEAADEIGIRLLNQAKIDKTGMIRFFEKLIQKEENSGSQAWLTYLSTHPASSERIKHIQVQPPLAEKAAPILTKQEWKALKNICQQTAPLAFSDKTDP